MNDGVVNDEHGGLDQAPVEIDIVVDGAGTPAIKVVDYFDFCIGHTELAGVMFSPGDDLGFGPLYIPFPQDLLPFSGVGGRNIKALVESNLG